jgi:F420-non-reducing hydrogenase large subunit
MGRRITIDPVTRLEGHARIDIVLNDQNEVEHAWLRVPELRGFEQFVKGRPVEEMPQITSRICGVCPSAHHMAATKALDAVYAVEPPPAAHKIRELYYCTFVVEDHALHFYFLGGPDFIVGATAPKAERNVLGVIARVGLDTGKQVIVMRRRLREILALLGGKAIHPVLGLPGGVARRVSEEERTHIRQVAAEAVEFAQFSLEFFRASVLPQIKDTLVLRTYYMGMVDKLNRLNFYDGVLRVVTPDGAEWARFQPAQYLDYIAEKVQPSSYVKSTYLKPLGESGIYAVAPLARLNASDGLATPLAQAAYEELFATLGPRPVHLSLANHWARLIEMLYAAERMAELAADPEITGENVRTIPTSVPNEGVGIVEAPRGTLIHHYATDERGLVRKANLIVATQHNTARIQMNVEAAAKAMIHGPEIPEEMLNHAEMAFRAYDPCYGCASHALPGGGCLVVRVLDREGRPLAVRWHA